MSKQKIFDVNLILSCVHGPKETSKKTNETITRKVRTSVEFIIHTIDI